MDLRRGRLSRNIEDRRGLRMPGNLKLGGCGSLLLILVLVFFFGPDSLQLLNSIEEASPNGPWDSGGGLSSFDAALRTLVRILIG